MRFNNLIACCRAYEKEIDARWLKDNTQAVDDLHDAYYGFNLHASRWSR